MKSHFPHWKMLVILMFLSFNLSLFMGCGYEDKAFKVTIDDHGLAWVSIPGGSFEMGCSPNDQRCEDDETPPHRVKVSGFKMTQTEITQAQYKAIIGDNPSRFQPPQTTDACPDCPVEQVNWKHAKAFCKAVDARLPSEAEWEYAARAGTETIYYCGDDSNCLDGIAWHDDNSNHSTHPVGTKTMNAFGLYDMTGNVWEWVEDCYNDDYTDAPSDGSPWLEGNCRDRLKRGGSYASESVGELRTSIRVHDFPNYAYRYYGFRCVKD